MDLSQIANGVIQPPAQRVVSAPNIEEALASGIMFLTNNLHDVTVFGIAHEDWSRMVEAGEEVDFSDVAKTVLGNLRLFKQATVEFNETIQAERAAAAAEAEADAADDAEAAKVVQLHPEDDGVTRVHMIEQEVATDDPAED